MEDKDIRKLYSNLDKHIFIGDDDTKPEFRKHFDKWNFWEYNKRGIGSLKEPGQIFLYESFEDDKIIYPKIGIFLNYLPCDQTIEVEWVNKRRNWEYKKKYTSEYKGETLYYEYVDLPTIIQSQPQWNDHLLIYGVWDKLPNWKTLKSHYQLTWWFHKTVDEIRNIKLEQIL